MKTAHSAPSLAPQSAPASRSTTGPSGALPSLLTLQGQVGNRAVGALLRAGIAQAKLRVSPADDPLEREADKVADAITSAGTCDKCQRSSLNVMRAVSDAGSPDMELSAASESVVRDLGPGRPLDRSTRDPFEAHFGRDLSSVRVHDGPSAARAADSVGARAFALGDSIAFNTGEFSPQTRGGQHLLAHEMTHVVQQTSSVRPMIQRYQAGDTGHGGIEKKGLIAAGFTPDQAAEAYLGNWMRDFSQMPPFIFPLINIIALGEFGREIKPEELGTYVPSEHLDNPEGGKTIEDKTYADEYSTDPTKRANFDKLWKTLSPSQQEAYRREEGQSKTIAANAIKSGLPEYIERGKLHSKDQLTMALEKGETPEGRKQLGNGLHAVEDYFSHSNFVEAGIYLLSISNPTDMAPLVAKASKIPLGLTGAANLDKSGKPQIVTGTYIAGPNTAVSLIETLVTEVETGQLRAAFVKGWLRKSSINADMIGRKVAEYLHKPVTSVTGAVGGALGAVSGLGSGAIRGGSRGAKIGGALGEISGSVGELVGEGLGGLIGGVVGGVVGAVTGFDKGEAEGEKTGEDILKAVGEGVGITIKGGLLAIDEAGAALLFLLYPEMQIAKVAFIGLAKSGVTDLLTTASKLQAGMDKVAGPTHSQLAKDDPDHELFTVSAALAQEAVTQIGLAMKNAWALNKDGEPPASRAEWADVTNLVDKFVSKPESDPWWQSIVLDHAKK